jgi:hypothetical protein
MRKVLGDFALANSSGVRTLDGSALQEKHVECPDPKIQIPPSDKICRNLANEQRLLSSADSLHQSEEGNPCWLARVLQIALDCRVLNVVCAE